MRRVAAATRLADAATRLAAAATRLADAAIFAAAARLRLADAPRPRDCAAMVRAPRFNALAVTKIERIQIIVAQRITTIDLR
jgi:hypothetical protein